MNERTRITTALRGGLAALLLLGAGVLVQPADAEELELVKEGTLVVALNGDMPGTGLEGGKLTGIDGELMTWVAEQLGLEVEPALMEWSAEIASVQSRRVDIMHGMMGWTEQRTEVINMSDPIYYAGALITQKRGTNWSTIADLEGKTIATIQGFGWIPDLKQIDAELKLYDTSDAAIRDLVAGRIDALFADPPLIQWVAQKNPDWDIHSVPLNEPFNPDMPVITGKYMVVFGLSKEAPNLLTAVNQAIAEMWQSCKNYEVAKEYGFADRYWFTPPEQELRAGIDRPKDWTPPTLPESCG